MQAVMTKNENPKERYKNLNLSGEQQLKLDQYALNLMNGELEIDQGDVYSLRRENESLKADLEVLKQKNFDTIAH
jgi:cell shape-determining protein MreC